MSLPPALLAKLAQRGLVQNQKRDVEVPSQGENEEVIAEDYDEMEGDERNANEEYQCPPQYDHEDVKKSKKGEENFWLERMRARMGEASTYAGYKGCPNKYNVWHKCTLYCVNRWEEGKSQPSREYLKRYKRLTKKYPLPKGWEEMYDPGCGCYYFHSVSEGLVSWLPPTHPKSVVTKSAAILRKKLEETGDIDEDSGNDSDDEEESEEVRHHRLVDEILNSSMRSPKSEGSSSDEYPPLSETVNSRKYKGRESDRSNFRPNRDKERDRDREHERDRDRERDRERDRDRDRDVRDHDREREFDKGRDRERERDRYQRNPRRFDRRNANHDNDKLDPMDPSSYSDLPRGKWSDGLHSGENERKKASNTNERERKRDRSRSRSISRSRSRSRSADSYSDHSNDNDRDPDDL